jgi:ligand-binding sensor domain-containing protein
MTATPSKFSFAMQEIPIASMAQLLELSSKIEMARFGSDAINKFDQTMETFTRYPILLASHITQDAAGLLWVTTLGGLYRLDPASGEIQHYSHDPNDGARSSCYKASSF